MSQQNDDENFTLIKRPVIFAWAKIMMAASIAALSAALSYFTFTLSNINQQLPGLMLQLSQVLEQVDPITREVEKANNEITLLLEEVKATRELLPAVLAESAAIRETVPDILQRVDSIERQVPLILGEITAVRETLPQVLDEMAAYRELVPMVMLEVDETQLLIPQTLEQVEYLVDKASVAGRSASEGAVTGFFTGIVKAPFSLLSDVGGATVKTFSKNNPDSKYSVAAAYKAVDQNKKGVIEKWHNPANQHEGVVEVLDVVITAQHNCRDLRLETYFEGKSLDMEKIYVCMNKQGKWEETQR